jgi:putative DNA primase/helicase
LTVLLDALIERGVTGMAALVYLYRLLKFSTFDEHLTDLGNARRLIAIHGQGCLHCAGLGWMVWDGRRWERDSTGEVQRRAKEIAPTWASDAEIVLGTVQFAVGDEERAAIVDRTARLMAWSKTCESARTLRAVIEVASTEPGIPIAVDVFDPNPWLFNAQNGTVDLRTGELRPHRREDLLRAICPVPYDPAARLPEWEDFLDHVTGGDNDLKHYIQKLVGYSITGLTVEELLLALVGPAGSGKSTFIKAITKTFGRDYVMTTNFDLFIKKRSAGSGPSPELARLAGARMVLSIEVDDGRELAEGLLKTVTGGDTITARFCYMNDFEFDPRFALWLVANDLPTTDADDSGMWRRLRVVPFLHPVPSEEQDPAVKMLLTNPSIAGPAILAWAVSGCLMWQREGLGVPPAVEQATEDHKSSMDTLAAFLEECCDLGPDLQVISANLYCAYNTWAVSNGEFPILTNIAFGRKLAKKGFHHMKMDGHRGWRGLSIKYRSAWERAAAPQITRAPLPPG